MAVDLAQKGLVHLTCSRDQAVALDASDTLRHLRSEFIIPTRDDLERKTLSKRGNFFHCTPYQTLSCAVGQSEGNEEAPCTYLCGNSLGLQPCRTAERVAAHLEAWATKGVFGHFRGYGDSELPAFMHIDEVAAQRIAPIVGASGSEVAVMETLSANLHLMMASFYRPTKARYKIILEGKAFPSDHVSVLHSARNSPTD